MAKLSNKEVLTRGQKYFDKKKSKNQIQEVTFDPNDRLEYLTGFHKRKVDRQKKAQKFKQEQSHKERLEERQRIRNERKQMVAEKLKLIKEEQEKMLRLANGSFDSSSSDDDDEDKDGKKKKNKKAKKAKFASDKSSSSDAEASNNEEKEEEEEEEEGEEDKEESEEEWKGFDDDDNERTTKGILKKKVVFNNIGERDGEPVNDETTVIIESLSSSDINNSNGSGGIDLYQLAKLNNVELKKSEEVLEKAVERAKKYAVLSGHEKPPKQKKRKFRYLTKAERRVNTHKERSKRFKRDDKDKK